MDVAALNQNKIVCNIIHDTYTVHREGFKLQNRLLLTKQIFSKQNIAYIIVYCTSKYKDMVKQYHICYTTTHM